MSQQESQEQNAKAPISSTTAINRILKILKAFPKEKAESILAFCQAELK